MAKSFKSGKHRLSLTPKRRKAARGDYSPSSAMRSSRAWRKGAGARSAIGAQQLSSGKVKPQKGLGYTLGNRQRIFSKRSYSGVASLVVVALVIAAGIGVGSLILSTPNAVSVASGAAAASSSARSTSYGQMVRGYLSSGAYRLANADASVVGTQLSDEAAQDSQLTLVNSQNEISDSYDVVRESVGADLSLQADAADALLEMTEDMSAAGLSPVVLSCYRPVAYDEKLVDAATDALVESGATEEDAKSQVLQGFAEPGHDDHETALAADIVASSVDVSFGLSDDLATSVSATPEYAWLMAHCANYGFIPRYIYDKVQVTGVKAAPWHFRYVGKQAAVYMASNGLSLEELASTDE